MNSETSRGTEIERLEEFQRRHRQALVVILFTDMVGSTNLKSRLGDAEAVRLISEHHTVLRELLRAEVNAEEISTSGDSMLLALASPSSAVRFALRAQAKVREFAQRCGQDIRDRMAIHVGEVLVEEESSDLQGLHVDTCARIMSLARGDQILLTRFAFDNARQALRSSEFDDLSTLRWLSHGHYALKGVEEPLEICEVGEEGRAALVAPEDSTKAKRAFQPEDEPVLGWRPAVGQVVPGTSWVLKEKLGEGGFGEVWLACHAKLGTRQVFKFCFRADRARSLKRELTLFRILQERVGHHPNIVGVSDVFLDESPFYLGMEYVEGADLATWCEKHEGGSAVPLDVRLDLVAQVADALQAAHDAGIIHRDVKPSNILIQEKPGVPPHAFLTDFGIGQVTSDEALTGVTRLGFTMTMMSVGPTGPGGTQIYMAPELLAGRPASTRSDIYSLGVILYQLIIGDLHQPLTTDWRARVEDPLLQEDLARCFAGDPEERFVGAAQLADALRSIEERRTERNRLAEEQAERERSAYRRGLIRATAGAVAVVVLVALLALVARREAVRAGANFRSAQKVVDDLMLLTKGMAGDQASATEPRILAHKLADSAVDNYRTFLAQRPDDAALRLNLAKVCRSRALIYAAGSGAGGPADEKAREVARESLAESMLILRQLMDESPDNAAVQEELAAALAAGALDRTGNLTPEGQIPAELAAEALVLRRGLATRSKNTWETQRALADLLRDVAAGEEAGAARNLVAEELSVRGRSLLLAPGPQRSDALIELSFTHERLAGLSDGPEKTALMRKAFEAVDSEGATGMPLVLRRLDLATLIARQQRLAGHASTAAEWSARIAKELARLEEVEIEPGSLSAARRSEADGLAELAESKEGITPSEALGLLARAVKIGEGLGAAQEQDFWPERLDGAWDATIRIASSAGMNDAALHAARSACTYWGAVWEDPSRAAASWFRLANLQSALGRGAEADDSLAEAQRLQTQIARRSGEELNALALLLATAAGNPAGPPGSGSATVQAIGVLREMQAAGVGLQDDYRGEIVEAFSAEAFRGNSEAAALLAGLGSIETHAVTETEPIEATDADMLARAMRADSHMRVKGAISSAQWTGSRRTLRMFFEGVPPGEFSAQISSDHQLELEAKLGGTLEEKLPGLVVEVRGYVYGIQGPPILVLGSVADLNVLERKKVAPIPKSVPVIPAADIPALRAALGSEALVEGDVAAVATTRSGLSTTIQFDSGGRETLLAVVFSDHVPAIEDKVGGPLGEAITGKRLRVTGTLMPYGGRNPAWVGLPQIVLKDPEQIEVIGEAASLDPADTAQFVQRAGASVTCIATVETVVRSAGGGVARIVLKEAGADGLSCAVFHDNEQNLAAKLGGSLEDVLAGRRVRFSGKVAMYEGRPEVVLAHGYQIDWAPTP